jgi:Fe-S-cluster-containing hydrogenase component 2
MTPKEKALKLFYKYETLDFKNCKDDFCKSCMLQCSFLYIDDQIKNLKEMDDKWHSCSENPMTTIFDIEIEFLELVKKELEDI